MVRHWLSIAACAAGLMVLAPDPAAAGRLDSPPMGGVRSSGYRIYFPRAPQVVRKAPAARKARRSQSSAPVEKIESPSYYDFTPEVLAPVDFGRLRTGAQVAGESAVAPAQQP